MNTKIVKKFLFVGYVLVTVASLFIVMSSMESQKAALTRLSLEEVNETLGHFLSSEDYDDALEYVTEVYDAGVSDYYRYPDTIDIYSYTLLGGVKPALWPVREVDEVAVARNQYARKLSKLSDIISKIEGCSRGQTLFYRQLLSDEQYNKMKVSCATI